MREKRRSMALDDDMRRSLLASVDIDDVAECFIAHKDESDGFSGRLSGGFPSVPGGIVLDYGSRTASTASTDALPHSVVMEDGRDEQAALLPPPQPPIAEAPKVNTVAGMAWFAGSACFFATMGICSKRLGMLGYNVWEINLVRGFMILTCVVPRMLINGDNFLGTRKAWLVGRGLLGVTSITCYFAACQLLPLADATVFTFLGPLVAACLSPLMLGEAPSFVTLLVIPVNIAGVVLVVQPDFIFGADSVHLKLIGVVIGLCQPFFSAASKVTVRALRTTETTNTIIFYYGCTMVLMAVAGCVYTRDQLVFRWKWSEIALLLTQGLSGFGNQTCITNGLRAGRAAPVMSMQYLTIVLSQAAGILVFNEYPDIIEGVGLAVIVVSMLLYIGWEASSGRRAAK